MPITVDWEDNHHQAINLCFSGQWTWEDLSRSILEVGQLADTVLGSIPLLIDMTTTKYIPVGNAAQYGLNNLNFTPTNISYIIIVNDSQVIKTLISMVIAMSPTFCNRTRFVKTLEEGQQILNKHVRQPAAAGYA